MSAFIVFSIYLLAYQKSLFTHTKIIAKNIYWTLPTNLVVNSPVPTSAPSRDTHHKSNDDDGLSASETNSVIIGATVAGSAIVIAAALFTFMYRRKTVTASTERNYNVEMNIGADPTSKVEAPTLDSSPSAPPESAANPIQHGAFPGETSTPEDVKIEDKV